MLLLAIIYNIANAQVDTKYRNGATTTTGEAVDTSKGIGRFTSVELVLPLNPQLIEKGRIIYTMKCMPCHNLDNEKHVGPGWKYVTSRRRPEWIMNYITNTTEMIFKDATGKKLLATYLLPMPDFHLNDEDARAILEFMRSNDASN